MQVHKVKQRSEGGNPLKVLLSKLWHLPDSFSWMEPLPYAHRRGVILATLLILCAFLWPSDKGGTTTNNTPVELSAPEAITTQPNAPPPELSQALNTPTPIQPPSLTSSQQTTETPASPQLPQPPVIPEQPANPEWKEFTIQKGHTLTQLFRENRFIVNDAFLLAQVEGPGKPLNALKIGQKIRVQLTQNKQVMALEVELSANKSALFTRQSDGRFRRER
ncbi:Opacity-associated protein A domain protein [Jinshanibacter sp. LJY008]|uniref:Opacity-associated protein A domain protein n=1 Tax=Limnobaculum eriocheiris TaxID=2897391 RepID=A0A9X1SKK3_9GAMM|nr:LysM-like peptidoglycan-binding domain-containing protein [Limnobaculum eriocheiris]MCD1125389.1 Opacity-associated protein A domain protein [Limnobaculum eriocheiris]